jgi:hypothetical protein
MDLSRNSDKQAVSGGGAAAADGFSRYNVLDELARAVNAMLLSAVNLGKAKKLFCAVALPLSFTVLTAQQHHHHHKGEGGDANAVLEKLSAVHMPISRAASVHAPFDRGIALLHSFWYEEALKQFQSVAAADPQCVMAHWAIRYD